jgi:hypothetical protein
MLRDAVDGFMSVKVGCMRNTNERMFSVKHRNNVLQRKRHETKRSRAKSISQRLMLYEVTKSQQAVFGVNPVKSLHVLYNSFEHRCVSVIRR